MKNLDEEKAIRLLYGLGIVVLAVLVLALWLAKGN